MRRLGVSLLFTVLLCLSVAAPGRAIPGSIIVGQLLLYDAPDGCSETPCGWHQVWWGRPLGPYAQMLALGPNESYGDYMAPVVSPTGRRIVYANAPGHLMIADLDPSTGISSNDRELVSHRVLHDAPTSVAWSPGGGRLVLMEGFAHKGLWIVGADGSGLRRLSCRCHISVYDGSGVAWSPGGRWIAFAGLVSGHLRIQVVKPDGRGLRTVSAPGGSYDAQPAWSPDGRRIAFVRGGNTEGEDGVIEVTSAHGHHARRIGPGTAPVYSPHGRWLAYADTNDGLRSTGLHITDLRSSARRLRLPSGLSAYGFIDHLTWLP